ncbi:DNA topoisomerase 3-alpha [Phtheirospermum japonicum]|uniref:DNA topoisomerase n=1 Tax=Phtheirospermum japonicum TaxID=374723 RepID=A0A830CA00_9LAMI|nr:DNA topoisomerase 3-alpha [Phtheirospermum japonicum]
MSSGGGRLIRALNVAEKPSVAKAVAGILSKNPSSGGLRVRDGHSRYNRIFEFNYTMRNQQYQMSVTSVTGHLMELDFDDRYRKWHSCDPADLYHAPVKKYVPQDKSDIEKTLGEEARKCQWLILWLDCDREGENIAYEHLGQPKQSSADAVDARQEIDLRIGAAFTRFQTMFLRDAFVLDFTTDSQNVVLSYGPCQFPTLGFIVERYWEIQSHEPEEFWTINCTHNSEEGTAAFHWMRGHLFDYTCATIIYEMCVQEPTATVTNVRQRETYKQPPHPLSTIELEKRASRYFRMSSAHTMKVAEELYQAGFISYPRTETDGFSVGTDLTTHEADSRPEHSKGRTTVQEHQGHPMWGSYAQRLLDPEAGLWEFPKGGGHDDKAHPPIHPTKFSAGESNWSQDHHKVYELVVRHFLACVSKPAVGAETTVDIDIAGEQFSSSGRVIIAKNYLDVYRFETWGGSMIPTYNYGQQFTPTTLTLDSGVTRPPPLLSEADLLDCMEKGEALVMGYDDMGGISYELWKPDLRSQMERDVAAVCGGTKRKAEVLETWLQKMKACFLDARSNKGKLFEAMAVFFERSNRSNGNEQQTIGHVVRKCGLCQESDMVLRKKPDGNFMVGCLGFPQASLYKFDTVSDAQILCTGPVYMIQFKFRRLEIPPNYNVDHLGCIGGCDDTLRQLVEVCGTGSRNISSSLVHATQWASEVKLVEDKSSHHLPAMPSKVIPEIRVLGEQRILLVHILLRVLEAVIHDLRKLLHKMVILQSHVPRVAHLVICGQLILRLIEGGSSIRVRLRDATSFFGKIMPVVEVQSHVEASVDQRPIPAEEVVVVAGVPGQMMQLSCLRLVNPYLAGVLFVVNQGILQMLVQLAVGNSSNSLLCRFGPLRSSIFVCT